MFGNTHGALLYVIHVLFLCNFIENKPKNSIEEVITSEKMAVVLTVQKEDIFAVQQWTDEKGYTWRNMSDGSTQWWDGSEWKHYGEH